MSPTERVKIKETDGSYNRKKEHELPVFVYGLEVQDETLTSGRRDLFSFGAEWSMDREMESRAERSLDEAGKRGPAGAVMCETRDLGCKMAEMAHIDVQ